MVSGAAAFRQGARPSSAPSIGHFACHFVVRPWRITAGGAMLVNSPPTDKTTDLDLGLQFGLGIDSRVTQSISLGMDGRHFSNLNRPNGSWLVTGFSFSEPSTTANHDRPGQPSPVPVRV